MKLLKSDKVNAFGGLNFVHHQLHELDIRKILSSHLPPLPKQSFYNWNDIFSTFLSIYFCGGQRIEDAKSILKYHFGKNPFFKLCSPDTLLKRLKQLQKDNKTCRTARGTVEHTFNHNVDLFKLNIELLKSIGIFNSKEYVLDYDNTIVFAEKSDCRMTYKRDYGYQPGVCLLNENNVLFVENRSGNSDAKSFQKETLNRLFTTLSEHSLDASYKFRADAASYQYDVFQVLHQNSCQFFIGARNSYVQKYFSEITHWEYYKKEENKIDESDQVEIGETTYRPFSQRFRKGQRVKQYRLLVKRKLNKTGQLNAFTGDAYNYTAIVTNDFDIELEEAITFYNRRGNAEKQFDILKNDFGWSSLPFSYLSTNTVFMYVTAICRNLYNVIIKSLSLLYKNVSPTDRMKCFVFSFVTKPAKWVRRGRQWYLRIYGELQLKV